MPKVKKTKIKKNIKKKVVKKKSAKKIVESKKTESPPLRIANSNKYTPEDKVEIKKIKKQATEKRIYETKDFVVYPKHGVGRIIAVEKATIGQIDIQFYKIFIEKEKLTLTVPINQQNNLRP